MMEPLDIQRDGTGFEETEAKLVECEEVLMRVARYTEPAEMVQRVCDHPAQIIALQKEVTHLKAQHFLPPICNHLVMDKRMQILKNKSAEARRTPAVAGTSQELQNELNQMTQNARES